MNIADLNPLGLISSALNYYGASSANAMNREMAEKQMAFQERMANTGYQRMIQDMKAAGINPVLAYKQTPTAAPTGASATMGNEYSSAVSSALEWAKSKEELANMRAMNDKIKADTKSAQMDAVVKGFSAQQIEATIRKILAEYPRSEFTGRLYDHFGDGLDFVENIVKVFTHGYQTPKRSDALQKK